MDALKIAFETIIVGLMAVPWILILYHGFSCLLAARCKTNPLDAVHKFFVGGGHNSGKEVSTLVTVFLITITYFIGSTVTPFADSLLDKSWGVNKSDGCIKVGAYKRFFTKRGEQLQEAYHPIFLKDKVGELRALIENDEMKCDKHIEKEVVKPVYDYHKFYVYNQSEHGFEILKQYYSQIVIQRGAVLNGLLTILFSLLYLILDAPFWLWGEGRPEGRKWDSPNLRPRYFVVFILGVLLTVGGYFGWVESEKEFDKNVIGLYYGKKEPQYFEEQMKGYEERMNTSHAATPTATPAATPVAKLVVTPR